MQLLKKVEKQFCKLKLMVMSDAPAWFILTHFRLNFLHRLCSVRSEMKIERDKFRNFTKGLQFDNDWFTQNIPTWLMGFNRQAFDKKAELNCMEIGSWQGYSAVFLLSYFENAKLTCIDTWEGADEHKSGDSAERKILSNIENTFDANVSEYKGRLTKYKGTSYQYFNDNFEKDKYDLIYIDGSHHSDDVIVDAVKSFQMLKVNGLMILDDYFWKYYPITMDNACSAINAFVRLKRSQIEVICFDYQLIVRKVTT